MGMLGKWCTRDRSNRKEIYRWEEKGPVTVRFMTVWFDFLMYYIYHPRNKTPFVTLSNRNHLKRTEPHGKNRSNGGQRSYRPLRRPKLRPSQPNTHLPTLSNNRPVQHRWHLQLSGADLMICMTRTDHWRSNTLDRLPGNGLGGRRHHFRTALAKRAQPRD